MLARVDERTLGSATFELRPARSRGLFSRMIMLLQDYVENRRQRQALMALDDHMLKDIGLSRAEAARIGGKSFDWAERNRRIY